MVVRSGSSGRPASNPSYAHCSGERRLWGVKSQRIRETLRWMDVGKKKANLSILLISLSLIPCL